MTENTLGAFFKLGGVAGLLAAMGRGSARDMKHNGVNSGWVAGVFAMVLMILGFAVSSSAAAASCAALGCDVVWVDDALPIGTLKNSVGSVIAQDVQLKDGRYVNEPFNFVLNPIPAGYTGIWVHQSPKPEPIEGLPVLWRQHFFTPSTSTGFMVGANDTLFTYVYLDPTYPPSEIMLQWHAGGWGHRAYWGGNHIPWGEDGTNARRYMGVLPPVGQWVRLEVPASAVGLSSATVTGMAYVVYDEGTVKGGGTVSWGRSGTVISATAPVNPPPPTFVPLPEVRPDPLLEVAPSPSTLSVSPVSTTPSGRVITATWTNIVTPSPKDWLGLYHTSLDGPLSFIAWCYPNSTSKEGCNMQDFGDKMASGSALFSLPSTLANGTYQLRLYSNDGIALLARSRFCVGIGCVLTVK